MSDHPRPFGMSNDYKFPGQKADGRLITIEGCVGDKDWLMYMRPCTNWRVRNFMFVLDKMDLFDEVIPEEDDL